jgi:hypothetical protein
MDVEDATTCRGRSRRECFLVAIDYLTEYQRTREIGSENMEIVDALRLCASIGFSLKSIKPVCGDRGTDVVWFVLSKILR